MGQLLCPFIGGLKKDLLVSSPDLRDNLHFLLNVPFSSFAQIPFFPPLLGLFPFPAVATFFL